MVESLCIRDLVELRPRPTVVRLDHLDGDDAAWISESFFLSAEIVEHLVRLKAALEQDSGQGVFVIGHYGAGKSHLLAYLCQQVRRGDLGPGDIDVVTVSLVDYRGKLSLENIVSRAVGLDPDEIIERGPAWDLMVAERPLLLLIDELSEFLRSKPDDRAFNEDIRFLQLLGERAAAGRLWIVAAMQEAIEHTGQLESAMYRKIKDRFPIRFLLGPAHVRDLVAHHLLVKRDGYKEAATEVAKAVAEALPGIDIDARALADLYPLHPATLELLEEVRDYFSVARGVVDYVQVRLGGREDRGVEAFLDRPWGEILTPDTIVDHFADLFEVQPEMVSVSSQVLPWYRANMEKLFEAPGRQRLAWRLLKLLMLVQLSRQRQCLRVEEAAAWLVVRATTFDPDANLELVRRTLETMAHKGRFVAESGGSFVLAPHDDSGARFADHLNEETARLATAPREELLHCLAEICAGSNFDLVALRPHRWLPRRVRWSWHDRDVVIALGDPPAVASETTAVCLRLPWSEAEGLAGVDTIIPAALEVDTAMLEAAAAFRLSRRALEPEVVKRAEAMVDERRASVESALRSAYVEARAVRADGRAAEPPRLGRGKDLDRWFEELGLWTLRRRFPSFERFAPSNGPLPKVAHQRFVDLAAHGELGSGEIRDDWVSVIREGYLVPMGLLSRQGRDYRMPGNLDKHELVKLVRPMIDRRVSISDLYEHLAQPVYGLVDDQIHLLLLVLLIRGDLDIVKGKRSYRELSESYPLPRSYDRIEPGRALSHDQLSALARACDATGIRQPSQWTVQSQKRAIRALVRKALEAQERLGNQAAQLRKIDAAAELVACLEGQAQRWAALDRGRGELEHFEHFLFEVSSLARFFADDSRLDEAATAAMRVCGEVARLRHLLGHPHLSSVLDEDARAVVDTLFAPPPLHRPDDVEEWLTDARSAWQRHVLGYRERHDSYWREVAKHPSLEWRPSPLAASRHCGLEPLIREAEELKAAARHRSCSVREPQLDFSPSCSCGFGVEPLPLDDQLERIQNIDASIRRRLELFFDRDAIRDRLRQWTDVGGAPGAGISDYLAGKLAAPEVDEIQLLDELLDGCELVLEVEAGQLLPSEDRSWGPDELLSEIKRRLDGLGARRLRLRSSSVDRQELASWCVARALAQGVPIPAGLTAVELDGAAEHLGLENVCDRALADLGELGVGRAVIDRLCEAAADGRLVPSTSADPLLRAAGCVFAEPEIRSAAELASWSRLLYGSHMRLVSLMGARWFALLERIATVTLEDDLPVLGRVLDGHREHQWLVVDGFGVPLLELLRANLDRWLPSWSLSELGFATVGEETTTAEFHRQLAAEGHNVAFVKVDGVDRLLHERAPRLDDLERLAAAELEVALGRIADSLDAERSILFFADHGFRLRPEGSGWTHGGSSTLERTVPVLELRPRRRS